jgi:hypothetical protein
MKQILRCAQDDKAGVILSQAPTKGGQMKDLLYLGSW